MTCNIGTLGVNGTATVTITVSSSVPGTLTNSASIVAELQDPVPGNNTDTRRDDDHAGVLRGAELLGPGAALAVPSYDGLFVKQADLNSDGANDLVVSMLASGLAVRMNDGHGNFARPCRSRCLTVTAGFALADLNRDGRVDIAVVTGSGLQV